MGSHSIDLQESVDDVFPKIQQAIGASDYKIKTIVPNETVMAEGGREFSWVIVIVLAILLWPAAIVYYFTRHRSGVTITASKKEVGCKITITSNGKTGDQVMQSIVDILQKNQLT